MAKRTKKWPRPTLVIKENNEAADEMVAIATAGPADVHLMLKFFKSRAIYHDAAMVDAERNNQLALFRAHAQVSSGFHRAVRIVEKELKIR